MRKDTGGWGRNVLLGYTLVAAAMVAAGLFYKPLAPVMLVAGGICGILMVGFLIWDYVHTRLFLEQKLQETDELLQEAKKTRDDFMANVSHEFRTPLNTICGMSELVMREQLEDPVRENVFQIQMAGKNLQNIVNDVLEYSELETGRLSIYEEPYNLSSVMNDVINMAIAQRGEKQLELIVDCDAKIPCGMVGNSEKICRIISGLVGNGIRFTDEGYVMVRVFARRERYGVNLCVTVRDTGIGIKPGQQERLLGKIDRVDTRQNPEKRAVELGLAVTKRLIERMDGFMQVKGDPEWGTEVQFVIPQRVEDARPIIEIKDREQIRAGFYLNMEKYSNGEVRDNYLAMIFQMAKQLEVSLTQCHNLAELKRREAHNAFTHVFVTIDEYREDKAYFDGLSKNIQVAVVLEPKDEGELSGTVRRLYKPFYALSVANLLNGQEPAQYRDGSWHMTEGFEAPDASVLVVDDSVMNLRVMEGLLRPYKVHVFTAASGEEALKMITWANYDLIFMDHMMPVMDGIETLHRIRKRGGRYCQNVPIVALTANAIGGAREMFLAEGFCDFVAKPIDLTNLERVLRKYLPENLLVPAAPEKSVERSQPEKPDEPEKHMLQGRVAETDEREEQEYRIDEKLGEMYCGGDRADYLDILKIYHDTGAGKCEEMQKFFEKQDWESYGILAHALKSTSLSIGAKNLSELAKKQELAGKENDVPYLLANHEGMLREYRNVLAEIEKRWGDDR